MCLKRRSELALLLAVGYRRRQLHRLILGEHGALLVLGLAVVWARPRGGVADALVASRRFSGGLDGIDVGRRAGRGIFRHARRHLVRLARTRAGIIAE